MKIIIIVLAIAVGVSGIIIFAGKGGFSSQEKTQNSISIDNGTQVINMTARGGYSPRKTIAQANMPTVIRVNTEGTFDCSSALRIPKLGYAEQLPSSGVTDIVVPPQKSGSVVRGLCAMGMYSFEIQFN